MNLELPKTPKQCGATFKFSPSPKQSVSEKNKIVRLLQRSKKNSRPKNGGKNASQGESLPLEFFTFREKLKRAIS